MKKTINSKDFITALAADKNGEIFELEGYAATGMAGSKIIPLQKSNTINMPYGGELMFLPERNPVLFNVFESRLEVLTKNPYDPGESIYPVAAFNSPGYVISHTSAYKEKNNAGFLPLFSYGAVGWHKGKFRSAAIPVDHEERQDLRLMKREDVLSGITEMRKKMPANRLRKHLEKCALEYGCPAGKNFFLSRFEAPLPTSRSCNAQCLGCISLQKTDNIPSSQARIEFLPSSDEIAELAIEHIKNVKNAVVSFGQGCEGDPIMEADTIEQAIRIIRLATVKGTINMNTNAGKPDIMEKLINSGLDSIRVSINSVRDNYYKAYFRPKGYDFSDVAESIDIAISKKKFVSINYLNCPGFTDSAMEVKALVSFIKERPINMIQWRNLNFDPARYIKMMNGIGDSGRPLGINYLINKIKKMFPSIMHGYFNPPKEKWNSGIFS